MATTLFGVRDAGATPSAMPEALLLGGLRWEPPASISAILADRGARRAVENWLREWSNAMASGQRVVERARAARSVEDERAASFSYGLNDYRVRWKRVGLPTVQGGTLWLDYGSSAQLTDVLREATAPGSGISVPGEYRPGNWSEWVRWADNRGRLFTEAARWAGARAIAALRAAGNWYQTEQARALAARREQEAAAAAATAAEAEAARREWEAEAPERAARMRRQVERRFADTRALAGLRARAPDLGPQGVVTLFRAAADAAAAAEAAGADEAAQDAAADAVIDETLSALDLLYPVAAPDYYVGTFGTLTVEWQALFLAAAYADDPTTAALPVAPGAYYIDTYGQLTPEWANLFQQLARLPQE